MLKLFKFIPFVVINFIFHMKRKVQASSPIKNYLSENEEKHLHKFTVFDTFNFIFY